MHIYVVNLTAAVFLLWNDNGFGVDMKLRDLFGVTWLTQKCWLRAESTHSPMWLRAAGLQKQTPTSTLANSAEQPLRSAGVQLELLRTQHLHSMHFRGLLLMIFSPHQQLGYNSVVPGWALPPSFIHRDQTAACRESSLMRTKGQ